MTIADASDDYGVTAIQMAMAMTVTMMKSHATGVARFELPLRGESLAA